MTTTDPTPPKAALVAIDIAKMRNEILIELPGRRRRRRLTVLNTRTEHDRFLAELQALGIPVVAGLEATGNYHRPLAWRLLQAGFEVRLVSSMALARRRHGHARPAPGTLAVPRRAGAAKLSANYEISTVREELWRRLI